MWQCSRLTWMSSSACASMAPCLTMRAVAACVCDAALPTKEHPMKRTPHLLSIQSHVVFGHAGNSAAVFPMQRLGVNVWPLHTVQFSNHTQYGQWAGEVMAAPQIPALVGGIDGIGELGNCDAVLSGYLGSA